MLDLQIDRYRIRPDTGGTFRLDRYADAASCREAIETPTGERAPQPSWSVYPGSMDYALKRLHDDWRTQTDSPYIEVDGDLDDVLERIADVWREWETWWMVARKVASRDAQLAIAVVREETIADIKDLAESGDYTIDELVDELAEMRGDRERRLERPHTDVPPPSIEVRTDGQGEQGKGTGRSPREGVRGDGN